ncbi:hypothetical protein CASFOL_020510 [Castilleja foliolosa]|uniref:GTD-binding domain-containing protein n=1 Tax=Castilleja foliolosa TaxID=1961234 RepID=A0ABD3D121_9LAMI
MAVNRFATMLHKNTNKITLILTYAALEWILIVLLLLNSLFSYLIIKFAEFFGLKPPCPWCTRIDHLFDPAKGDMNMNRKFLCEVHSKEISKLGFCSVHQKLVDSKDMCEDCLSSRPEIGDFQSKKEKVAENGEVSLNCSCCGVSLVNNNDDDKYSSYVLLKTSSWDDVLEYAHKENLIPESEDYVSDFAANGENELKNKSEKQMISEFDENLGITDKNTEGNGFISVTVDDLIELERGENENSKDKSVQNGFISAIVDELIELERGENENSKDKSVQVCVEEDKSIEDSTQHLEFFLDYSGHKLVPIELIDFGTDECEIKEDATIEEDDLIKDREVDSEVQVIVNENVVVLETDTRNESRFLDIDINEEAKYEMLESMETEEDENSLVFHAKGSCLETNESEHLGVFPLNQWPSEETSNVQEQGWPETEKHSDVQTDNVACEEASQGNNENEADVSIGTEIPDLDITDEIQVENAERSCQSVQEDSVTSSANLDDHGPTQVKEQTVEIQSVSIQDHEHTPNNQSTFQIELNKTEEDKIPDTPTSIDLDKKSLLLENQDFVTEESIDGSVTSELDGGDGVVTIEQLKSALKTERKALQALYAELEEERSASAVATNQTMAMINRLQEEKAAMQMEALQYQRMMEEQSEYDQEALQLLNELMVKREKEKQEVERELEVYRKKLSDYETREKFRVLKKSRDGFSSASCSNTEDSDGLSIDLNHVVKEEVGVNGNSNFSNLNTPVDAVVNLEESLADFEEERLSILEQLKVLEEKLVSMDDENEVIFEDVNGPVNLHENGHSNGYSNGKHYTQRRIVGQKGKSLLPLFDAISDENGDGMTMNGNVVDHDSYESNSEMENKKDAIEEEVDHLYERLQALEADREFLKHCMSSLKKGDKGMDLLQEILQHLRDLRNVELRARNFGDGPVV